MRVVINPEVSTNQLILIGLFVLLGGGAVVARYVMKQFSLAAENMASALRENSMAVKAVETTGNQFLSGVMETMKTGTANINDQLSVFNKTISAFTYMFDSRTGELVKHAKLVTTQIDYIVGQVSAVRGDFQNLITTASIAQVRTNDGIDRFNNSVHLMLVQMTTACEVLAQISAAGTKAANVAQNATAAMERTSTNVGTLALRAGEISAAHCVLSQQHNHMQANIGNIAGEINRVGLNLVTFNKYMEEIKTSIANAAVSHSQIGNATAQTSDSIRLSTEWVKDLTVTARDLCGAHKMAASGLNGLSNSVNTNLVQLNNLGERFVTHAGSYAIYMSNMRDTFRDVLSQYMGMNDSEKKLNEVRFKTNYANYGKVFLTLLSSRKVRLEREINDNLLTVAERGQLKEELKRATKDYDEFLALVAQGDSKIFSFTISKDGSAVKSASIPVDTTLDGTGRIIGT